MNRTTLFGLIVLAIIILGFTFYKSINNPEDKPVVSSPLPKPTATPIPPTTVPSAAIALPSGSTASAAAATANFYNAYNKCLQNPPVEAAGQPSLYCQNNNFYGSYDLARNLETSGVTRVNVDAILCAQNAPHTTKVAGVKPENGKTIATVLESFGSDTDVTIKVTVAQENGEWKVNAINCPKP